MQPFEFLIPKRPVSLQTKNRQNLQAWKNFVHGEAKKVWNNGTLPVSSPPLRFSIVYLCDNSPADVDNIIKPIQDALVGLVFEDDFLVSDVDSHRRFLADPIDVTTLPPLLQTGVAAGNECVFVRVSDAQDLRSYL
jgi:crossover junction endodeoxyribonuclease RusA